MAGSRFAYERQLHRDGIAVIAGVDEAGRGPLAGPVVAAAVVFPEDWILEGLPRPLRGLNDSKQLTPEDREAYYARLTAADGVRWAVAAIEPAEIDRVNILKATHSAMAAALERLAEPTPEHVLVDGLPVPTLRWPHTAIVAGDARSYTIAAASVIAKVTRDRIMLEFDRLYPAYGFARHKGYPTPDHLEALQRLGPCPIHRRSFAPVREQQLEFFDRGPCASASLTS